MAFDKALSNKAGLSKDFGNAIPADAQSNKGPTSGSKFIGNIKGRLSFGKSSVASLNAGEWGTNCTTKPPGKSP